MDNDLEVASDLISHAFNIVVATEQAGRPPNDDELEQLIHALIASSVSLKKLPGGAAAAERVYARASAELGRRGLSWVAPPKSLPKPGCPVCGEGEELGHYPPTFLPARRRPLGASYSCGHFISIPEGQR
jgi:hypothetical protein